MHALTYTARVVRAQGLYSCRACVKFCLTDFCALPTDRWDLETRCQFNQSTKYHVDYVSRVLYGTLRCASDRIITAKLYIVSVKSVLLHALTASVFFSFQIKPY